MSKQCKGMWQYLESIPGLLERGIDLEINAAKKAYRKKYLTEYKRKQRSGRAEFCISILKGSQDYNRIMDGAKRHGTSVPALLRSATIAYLDKAYIVPHKAQLVHIEQLLGQCINEIQTIARGRQKDNFFDRERKYEQIEGRIERLEREIEECLRHPLAIEDYVKRAVTKDRTLKDQLLAVLNGSNPDVY